MLAYAGGQNRNCAVTRSGVYRQRVPDGFTFSTSSSNEPNSRLIRSSEAMSPWVSMSRYVIICPC